MKGKKGKKEVEFIDQEFEPEKEYNLQGESGLPHRDHNVLVWGCSACYARVQVLREERRRKTRDSRCERGHRIREHWNGRYCKYGHGINRE